jgi:hypothetical protein
MPDLRVDASQRARRNRFLPHPAEPGHRAPQCNSDHFAPVLGSTEPSSTGRTRRLLPSKGITEFRPNGRKRRPSRDDGDGEFDRFCASVRRGDRDCNMNRQRHLTPLCGGFAPTAERTVGPARMFAGSLTPSPGIREQNLHFETWRDVRLESGFGRQAEVAFWAIRTGFDPSRKSNVRRSGILFEVTSLARHNRRVTALRFACARSGLEQCSA